MKISVALHLAASLVTVITFLTGSSSLPSLFNTGITPAPTQTLSTGILAFYSPQLSLIIVLIGAPLFSFFDTWFGISLSKTFLSLLSGLGVEIAGGVWRIKGESKYNPFSEVLDQIGFSTIMLSITLLMILPAVIGVNLLYQLILFGDITAPLPISLVVMSTILTAVIYRRWLRKDYPLGIPVIHGVHPGSGPYGQDLNLQIVGENFENPIRVRFQNENSALEPTWSVESDTLINIFDLRFQETDITGCWDVHVLSGADRVPAVRVGAFRVTSHDKGVESASQPSI